MASDKPSTRDFEFFMMKSEIDNLPIPTSVPVKIWLYLINSGISQGKPFSSRTILFAIGQKEKLEGDKVRK
jgi:hypothetical protein